MPSTSRALINTEVVASFLSRQEAIGRNLSARETVGGLALFSYDEPIAVWTKALEIEVEMDWKYSRTTSRHRKLLVQQLDRDTNLRETTRERIRERVGLDPLAPPAWILSI